MCWWISSGSIPSATGMPSSLTPFPESTAVLGEGFASRCSFGGKLFPVKMRSHAFAHWPSWHWVMVNALIAFLLNAWHSDSVTRARQLADDFGATCARTCSQETPFC